MVAKPASRTRSQDYDDWQLQHYASVGNKYGDQHFTRADSPYTRWILEKIASVSPNAEVIAEVGAGTCVFSSLLGKKMHLKTDVVCYEPVRELLKVSAAFDNVEAVCGDSVDLPGAHATTRSTSSSPRMQPIISPMILWMKFTTGFAPSSNPEGGI